MARKTVDGGSKSESDTIMPIKPSKPKRKGNKVNPTRKRVYPNGM